MPRSTGSTNCSISWTRRDDLAKPVIRAGFVVESLVLAEGSAYLWAKVPEDARGHVLIGLLGWTAPDGIACAKMRSLQISLKGGRRWNRLAELGWIPRNASSNFTG